MGRVTSTACLGMLIIVALAAGSMLGSSPSAAAQSDPAPRVVHQLRIYEIFDSNKKAFHERFRDHAVRIMERYGFKILATWESRRDGRTEFVYLLEWPDAGTMKASWARFLADEEWIRIKKETRAAHGTLVGEIEDRTLELTDDSPQAVWRARTPTG